MTKAPLFMVLREVGEARVAKLRAFPTPHFSQIRVKIKRSGFVLLNHGVARNAIL